ncbi:hypothetical protein [Stenotrophomonas sp. SRS1]|nr:hypothetical protein [Stenotrophomonas sp. SRS1]
MLKRRLRQRLPAAGGDDNLVALGKMVAQSFSATVGGAADL